MIIASEKKFFFFQGILVTSSQPTSFILNPSYTNITLIFPINWMFVVCQKLFIHVRWTVSLSPRRGN